MVIIEKVGNLVCPETLFGLGEACRVTTLLVAEGEDRPAKDRHMFQASSLMLLNKIDLLPQLDFDVERARAFAREVHSDIEVLQASETTGEGLESRYSWIEARRTYRASRVRVNGSMTSTGSNESIHSDTIRLTGTGD